MHKSAHRIAGFEFCVQKGFPDMAKVGFCVQKGVPDMAGEVFCRQKGVPACVEGLLQDKRGGRGRWGGFRGTQCLATASQTISAVFHPSGPQASACGVREGRAGK